jgi:hypothetical protein
MNTVILRIRSGRVVPFIQHPLQFIRRQKRQFVDLLLRLLHQRRKQEQESLRPLFDGLFIKQIGGILQRRRESRWVPHDRQSQIKLAGSTDSFDDRVTHHDRRLSAKGVQGLA